MKELDPELLRLYLMGGASPPAKKNVLYSTDKNEVDLHMDQSKIGKGKIEKEDVLIHQLAQFEKAIDDAIVNGKFELRLIHGVGEGKLLKALHERLAQHPHVKTFSNDYHSRYGYGSTLVVFK